MNLVILVDYAKAIDSYNKTNALEVPTSLRVFLVLQTNLEFLLATESTTFYSPITFSSTENYGKN